MIDRSCDISQDLSTLSANEHVKANSQHLRGTIAQSLEDALTGSVPHDDTLLMKFHGIYQQDDRDVRPDRARRKLEPNYQFMVRMRIPGGLLSRDQWQGIDAISRNYADRGIRITTRQTIQLHGVRKGNIRLMMQDLRALGLDTIAACGDDSRGVVCGANPATSDVHYRVADLARETSNRLIPKTGAYEQIWYGEDRPAQPNEDPQYGPQYLPRKFKVGYVIPPINDVDIYGQDLGFIAIIENNQLLGFNICVGGGMGQLDTREDSYPRVAEVLGFVGPDEAPEFAEIVMGIQRDFGDRKDRHRSRFKYTLDRLGNTWFLDELAARRGKALDPARPFELTQNGDALGWEQSSNGLWNATLYIENGRVDGALRDQLHEFFQQYGGRVRMTCNQNLQLVDIDAGELTAVKQRLVDMGLSHRLAPDLQAAYTLSCVALPTCGLAMAEAERYMPELLDVFNGLKAQHALSESPITLRITGCPNGCARPYLAEIALTGRAPGRYNLYLGGSFHGDRLAKLYASNVSEERFLELLAPLFKAYREGRQADEHFGDFLIREDLLSELPVTIRAQ